MAYKTTAQVSAGLRVLWDFNFRNKNKETGEYGPAQSIIICTRAISKGRYTKHWQQKKEAVSKFTKVVETLYPKADQIVSSYGPLNQRVFV